MMHGKSGFDDMIVPGSVTFNSFETYVYGEGNSPKIICEENGDPKTKRFYLSRNLENAVYKNSGKTTHTTPTPWYQFCFGRTHIRSRLVTTPYRAAPPPFPLAFKTWGA